MFLGMERFFGPSTLHFMTACVEVGPDEGRQLTQFLETLSREYGQPFEQIFDEIVPTFEGFPALNEGFPALVEEEKAGLLPRGGNHGETTTQQY